MEIIVETLNFKASKHLEEFINQKVSKLSHHSNKIIKAIVVLREEELNNPNNKLCEIKLMVPGYDHFAKTKTDLYEKSISQAVDVLQKMLLKAKNKEIFKRHLNDLY